MSGAARILAQRGATLRGSDSKPFAAMEELQQLGIGVFLGHQESNLHPQTQLVVISAAIPDSNPELAAARERGIPMMKYAQLLGALLDGRRAVAVAGTHGKTTTTSMIAFSLRYAGLGPGFLIGGAVPQLGGNSSEGDGKFFVAEACEFDRSFLNLSPEIAVITNIDRDHLDYYKDLGEIRAAFGEFAKRVRVGGTLVLGPGVASQIDWPSFVDVLRVGEEIRPEVTGEDEGRYTFRLRGAGLEPIGEISLRVPGRFNVDNAAAAAAALLRLGLTPIAIREALSRFAGAQRRFSWVGERAGVTVIDDYGHHPTELRVVLQAARQVFPGRRLLLAFQPHQASRTRILFHEFVEVLQRADQVFLPEIFRARDSEEDWRAVSSHMLAEEIRRRGGSAVYRPSFDEILEEIERAARPGDVLLTMGAGNIDEIASRFVRIAALPLARASEA